LFGANLGRPAAKPTVKRQKLCRDFDVSEGGGSHAVEFRREGAQTYCDLQKVRKI